MYLYVYKDEWSDAYLQLISELLTSKKYGILCRPVVNMQVPHLSAFKTQIKESKTLGWVYKEEKNQQIFGGIRNKTFCKVFNTGGKIQMKRDIWKT